MTSENESFKKACDDALDHYRKLADESGDWMVLIEHAIRYFRDNYVPDPAPTIFKSLNKKNK